MEENLSRLREKVKSVFIYSGYSISDDLGGNIDFVSSNSERIYIIKMAINVDTVKEDVAREIKLFSNAIHGFPLIIGERTTVEVLQDSILYTRYRIPVMNFKTFVDFFIREIKPLGFSAPGGFYVKIDGKKLRSLREMYGISLGEMANIAKVSRKSIQLYEDEKSAVSIDVIMRIEERFNISLILPVEPWDERNEDEPVKTFPKNEVEFKVYNIFSKCGFSVTFFRKTPFEGLLNAEETLIMNLTRNRKEAMKRLSMAREISSITGKKNIIITEGKYEENLPVIPLEKIEKKERDEKIQIIKMNLI
ncbi:MAG: transcriptional regulator [Thermoplasmata archaeon]